MGGRIFSGGSQLNLFGQERFCRSIDWPGRIQGLKALDSVSCEPGRWLHDIALNEILVRILRSFQSEDVAHVAAGLSPFFLLDLVNRTLRPIDSAVTRNQREQA